MIDMASETIISESNPQKLICADLDEFFAEFDETGVPRGTPHVVKPLEAEFLPPSTREEAEFVRHVFDVVYEGTYPFPEMLDPTGSMRNFSIRIISGEFIASRKDIQGGKHRLDVLLKLLMSNMLLDICEDYYCCPSINNNLIFEKF